MGCGRVGLPLALCLAASGQPVVGVETNPAVRESLSRGEMPFPDPFSARLLSKCREADGTSGLRFRVTGDLAEAVATCDVFILALGTPLGPGALPEQRPIYQVAERIIGLAAEARVERRPPPLIIIRSTVAPGTTDGLGRAISRRFGLHPGRDFLLAMCPERTLEGHAEELLELPQIVGAADSRSRAAAEAVFRLLGVPLIPTGTVEAELAKLFCNAHRYVAFALANEFLLIARHHGASVFEALRAANQGYKRGGIPGPGFASGPCLFKDGFILSESFPAADLLLTSWKLNEGLPEYFVREVERIRGLTRVAVLGLSFKADSDDTRNSLGLKLVELLERRGADFVAHDPFAPVAGVVRDLAGALNGAGEVFVTVPHREYRELPWEELTSLVRPGAIVVDPWQTWGQADAVVQLAAGTATRR